MTEYLDRLVDPWIEEVLAQAPAIMITGARATGKTTTAMRYARSVVRLDDPAQAAPFRADPDAALRDRPEPVLLDEWQACAEVLGALKRAVYTERRPGRFIVTGSVHSDIDPAVWPGIGRLITIPMHPLTVREQLSAPGRPLIERLVNAAEEQNGRDAADVPGAETPQSSAADEPPGLRDLGATHQTARPPDLRDYAELALPGGFPEPATQLRGQARHAWLESYVRQVGQGAAALGRGFDPARLGAFFNAYALNSGGIVNDSTLDAAAGIDRRTARGYVKLLTDIGMVAELPAWSTNRLKRLTRRPKRYVADCGLWAAAVGTDTPHVMSDGDLLGRLIDTFVMSQLRAEAAVDHYRPMLYHLRDADGRHEIDVIADLRARGVVAIEIKASSVVNSSDARHLAWLRDSLGAQFIAGVVLHTGPAAYSLSERITAIPMSTLWNSVQLANHPR